MCVYEKWRSLGCLLLSARGKAKLIPKMKLKSLEVVGACARAPWLSFGANQKHGETYKHARSLFPTASFLSNYRFIPSGGDPLQIISFYYYFLPPRCCYVCVCARANQCTWRIHRAHTKTQKGVLMRQRDSGAQGQGGLDTQAAFYPWLGPREARAHQTACVPVKTTSTLAVSPLDAKLCFSFSPLNSFNTKTEALTC